MTVEHLPCPSCGSADNLIRWDDGHTYCFTPGCNNRSNSTNDMTVSDTVKNFNPIKLLPVRLPKRRLLSSTCNKYGIGVYDNQIHFPYYVNGVVVGYKVRNTSVPKDNEYHFYVKGSINNILFGNQCVHNKNVISICSGEYDAPSIYQMTGVTGLSLHCDRAAESTIKHNLEWLETFERIILCIDNDDSGHKAIDTISKIIRPYQLYTMVFPTGYKDASQMLVDKQSDLFKSAFWSAKAVPIKTIFTPNKLTQELLSNYEVPKGIPVGIQALDNTLGGLRPGELTTILAKTHQGKSTFSRIVMSNLLRMGIKCMIVALEERPINYTRRLLHTYAGRPLDQLSGEERQFLVNELVSNLILSTLNGKVTPKELSDCLEYTIRKEQVSVILIDNLSAAVDRSKLFEQTSELVEAVFRIAKQFNVHILIVCHIHRSKKDEDSIEGGYGSSAIEHVSDNMIVVKREDESDNKVTISLVKNRELGKLTQFTTVFNPQTARYVFKTSKKQQTRANNTRQLSGTSSIIEVERSRLNSLYSKEPSS